MDTQLLILSIALRMLFWIMLKLFWIFVFYWITDSSFGKIYPWLWIKLLAYLVIWNTGLKILNPYLTKMLFISLVRPTLEYGSIIWDLCYAVHINWLIDSVQKQFLIFCLRGLGWNSYELPLYRSRLALIKLPTLKSRRSMMSILFILGLIRGDVDSEFFATYTKFLTAIRLWFLNCEYKVPSELI